jgi:hypothetical protein
MKYLGKIGSIKCCLKHRIFDPEIVEDIKTLI